MKVGLTREDALKYHSQGQPGKIEVVPTKILSSQRDLALAYSPGVAEPCLDIRDDEDNSYLYTSRGNLVAVISDGTAVLGLGNIGAVASKPVMEGKGVLFKKFAGIDVFDIEVNSNSPADLIHIVKSLEPTFGGINLEDIKAPECFEVEDTLKKQLKIPVMHDDQHGTAIITGAALLNALELAGKKIGSIKMVACGAGASGITCARLMVKLGVKKENIIMTDSKGVIRKDRKMLDPNKAEFATDIDIHTVQEAIQGADFFLGLSKGNLLTKKDLQSMAADPIVFALANPDPEISYAEAMAARDDVIMATGRSDNPNQVNNVLGFPYIFRGALDVRATAINEEMKLAAVKALAALTKEPVSDFVLKAYGEKNIVFGRNYLIPKPMDPRLITSISPAVARAAMESGVARKQITDWEQYEIELQKRIGIDQTLIHNIISRSKRNPKRVVFTEAENFKILEAVQIIQHEEIAIPILLGDEDKIRGIEKEYNLDIGGCKIVSPLKEERLRQEYGEALYEKRKRRGLQLNEAIDLMIDKDYFGAMMVGLGDADALISGISKHYSKTIDTAIEVLGNPVRPNLVAGMYILNTKKGTLFFSDTTVNVNPTVDELVKIIEYTATAARFFHVEPRIAVLSYSNFGSSEGEVPRKAREAVNKARHKFPELIIDGDIQANIAMDAELQQQNFPFSHLAEKGANTFIFPNLASGNIAYKFLMELGGVEAIGPVLLGISKPVHVLQVGSSVRDIVNMVAIAVVDAQTEGSMKPPVERNHDLEGLMVAM
ncbi:MAG: NADP-dependent malic enzyme [Cyclobacteriaceae bacterium]|nr:NADP-dependent malic enzyme [Cyclobacteriaceae bacterium]